MTPLFEGTLDEVREFLKGLSLRSETRVQIDIVEEFEAMQEEGDSYADLEQKYANWPRRNGILQIPSARPLTIDEINEMRED